MFTGFVAIFIFPTVKDGIIPYLTIKLKDLSVFAHERNFGSV